MPIGGGTKFKEEIVLYVVYQAIKKYGYKKIDRLQVVKILYLIDDLLKKTSNDKISEYDYILDRLGPYDPQIIVDLTKLVNAGKLTNTNTYYEYLLKDINEIDIQKIHEIDLIIQNLGNEIVKQIIGFFELGKNLNELLDFVHSKEEVKQKKLGEIVL